MQVIEREKKKRAPRPPSRRELLDAASKATSRGQLKAAIGHYLRTLEHHGADPTLDAKIAALYAKLKRHTRARAHFESATAGFHSAGLDAKALAVCRSAVALFPKRIEFWQRIVDLQRTQGRSADAVATLIEARKAFKGAPRRGEAVRLLEQIVELAPGNAQASLDLALQLIKVGRRAEARASLEALVAQSEGARLRRVRGALFRLSPTPATAWRWLRAALFSR